VKKALDRNRMDVYIVLRGEFRTLTLVFAVGSGRGRYTILARDRPRSTTSEAAATPVADRRNHSPKGERMISSTWYFKLHVQ